MYRMFSNASSGASISMFWRFRKKDVAVSSSSVMTTMTFPVFPFHSRPRNFIRPATHMASCLSAMDFPVSEAPTSRDIPTGKRPYRVHISSIFRPLRYAPVLINDGIFVHLFSGTSIEQVTVFVSIISGASNEALISFPIVTSSAVIVY